MSQTEDYDVRWGISAEADKFLRNNSDSVFMHCLQKERMRKKKKKVQGNIVHRRTLVSK